MSNTRVLRRAVALALVFARSVCVRGADNPASPAMDVARQLNRAFVEVADKVSPSVVVIRVAHKLDWTDAESDNNPFFDLLPPETRRRYESWQERRRKERRRPAEPTFDGQGSGVIIREDGYILTNSHVVDGADKIEVRLRDGHSYPAEVRGVDVRSDIAVVRINARGLPAAKIADSDRTRVGEFAIAIGAPFNLDYSVTFGHVSAKGRAEILPAYSANVPFDQEFIQTDASINPGNSGGPLVNIEGEVIGINSMIRGLHTGIGFAIPSNLARDISESLMSDGKVVRARLGVEVGGIHEDERVRDQTFAGVANGVFVFGIKPDGAAAKSDLKLEDVITAIDGQGIASAQQLRNAIRNKVGVTITLNVVRNGKPVEVRIKPEEWPDEPVVAAATASKTLETAGELLGLTVKTVTKELSKEHQIKAASGVVVTDVDPGSPAELIQIKPGDLITEVDGRKISSIQEFYEALKKSDLRVGVRLNLLRGRVSRVETLKTPGP